jgi:hypothetical protein
MLALPSSLTTISSSSPSQGLRRPPDLAPMGRKRFQEPCCARRMLLFHSGGKEFIWDAAHL